MTSPWRPGQVQRRCTCCGEMRWPPVCRPCDALLPPVDYTDDPAEAVMCFDCGCPIPVIGHSHSGGCAGLERPPYIRRGA